MKKEWFEIIDIKKFLDVTRIIVYSSFGSENNSTDTKIVSEFTDLSDQEQQEINHCLTYSETQNIAKDYILIKKSKKDKYKKIYKISDESYQLLIEALYSRMVSNMLNKMASENILESAFDEQLNDFVFWIKEDDNLGDDKNE